MDNQILLLALALVAITCSVVLLLNWYSNRAIPGLFVISVGFAATGTGILLLSTQAQLPVAISIILANTLLLGGRIPVLLGLARFWNQDDSRLPLIASIGFGLTMTGFLYFTYVVDSMIWRQRIFSVTLALMAASNIYLIINGLKLEKKLRPLVVDSKHVGARLAIGLFTFNIASQAILLLGRSGAPIGDADSGTSVLLLINIVTMVIFAFAIILMTMDELCLELKENAVYDPVTSILSHRTFLEIGQRLLTAEAGTGNPVSMVTAEIENLGEIEEQYGTEAMNEMLRHFSRIAISRRRPIDVLARSTVNKFRMLLPMVDEEHSKLALERVKAAAAKDTFSYQGKELEIHLRLAAITHQGKNLDIHAMLQDTETQLENSKQQEREEQGNIETPD